MSASSLAFDRACIGVCAKRTLLNVTAERSSPSETRFLSPSFTLQKQLHEAQFLAMLDCPHGPLDESATSGSEVERGHLGAGEVLDFATGIMRCVVAPLNGIFVRLPARVPLNGFSMFAISPERVDYAQRLRSLCRTDPTACLVRRVRSM
jgi:hypothetical protein